MKVIPGQKGHLRSKITIRPVRSFKVKVHNKTNKFIQGQIDHFKVIGVSLVTLICAPGLGDVDDEEVSEDDMDMPGSGLANEGMMGGGWGGCIAPLPPPSTTVAVE